MLLFALLLLISGPFRPSSKGKELPLSQALHSMHYDKLVRTTKVEIEKQQRIGCIGTKLYTRRELPHTSLQVRAHAIYKDKADGRETCRIAAMGNKLPRDPDVLTSSTVASDEEKAFSLSLMQAYCKGRGEIMQTADADIVGGFLRIKRDSSTRMFLQFPHNLPHPYAGLFVEVFRVFICFVRKQPAILAAGFHVDLCRIYGVLALALAVHLRKLIARYYTMHNTHTGASGCV